MGRPRNICFFEIPLPQVLPKEVCWLPAYHENSRRLIAYIVEHGAGSTAYHVAINCLTELRLYLIKEGFPYSDESSARWLKDTGPHPKGCKATLHRLSDLYMLLNELISPHCCRLLSPFLKENTQGNLHSGRQMHAVISTTAHSDRIKTGGTAA